MISRPLYQLPIPGAEATGSNVLAFRNMIRAKFYDMPSGQTLARHMGVPSALRRPAASAGDSCRSIQGRRAAVVLHPRRVPRYARTDGASGPVGSRIVNETFTATLLRDPDSILRGNAGFQPAAEIAGPDGKVQFSDILRFAGVTDTETD